MRVPKPIVVAAACAIVACGARRDETTPHHAEHAHRAPHHHRFDDAEGWSKVFDDPARDAWQKPDRVIALLRLQPGMRVADVGAGTGYFEPHLSRAVGAAGEVLAVDVEPGMVEHISKRATREGLANVKTQLGAADDPKLAAGAFDRVLVVDTWHHVEDRVGFAKKIARGLRAGGALFVVDFTKESPHGPPAAARIPPEELKGELESAGFGNVKIHASAATGLPHQYVVEGSLAP
jgi:ubiquinone/menaquinone biosynthesis C-methylase UbiE